MTHRIPPQRWMIDANTHAVMQALTNDGATARFVGGCVRDALLSRPINDIDIATNALPDQVIALLEMAGIKAIPTGLKHGTITAVANHQPFEITTLRNDVESFGRHANVAFSASWQEDAARRDFTMNAMSLEIDGTLHDYFGGFEDAKAGFVRFVGNPETRLQEDYLRLLRYFRFHAYYGKGDPDPSSLSACVAQVENMKNLSGERIRQELLRLFNAPNPLSILKTMQEADVFHHLFTKPKIDLEQKNIDALSRYINLETKHGLAANSLCRMAVLLKPHLDNKQARKLANRLVLSNREKANWLSYCLQSMDPRLPMDSVEVYQKIDQFGGAGTKNLLAITAAQLKCDIPTNWWEYIDEKAAIPFPLHGRDALAINIPAGPALGNLLKLTRLWWLEGGFTANKAACLDHLSLLAKDKKIS